MQFRPQAFMLLARAASHPLCLGNPRNPYSDNRQPQSTGWISLDLTLGSFYVAVAVSLSGLVLL